MQLLKVFLKKTREIQLPPTALYDVVVRVLV